MTNPGGAAETEDWLGLSYEEYQRYLTPHEVAKRLRLSERTLERHRLHGTGPSFIKMGRRVVYRLRDIESWAKKHTFRSTSEVEA